MAWILLVVLARLLLLVALVAIAYRVIGIVGSAVSSQRRRRAQKLHVQNLERTVDVERLGHILEVDQANDELCAMVHAALLRLGYSSDTQPEEGHWEERVSYHHEPGPSHDGPCGYDSQMTCWAGPHNGMDVPHTERCWVVDRARRVTLTPVASPTSTAPAGRRTME